MGCINSKPNYNNYSLESTKPYIPNFKWAKILRVYDGDSITIAGGNEYKVFKYSARLIGVDTPEMRPILSQEEQKLSHNKKLHRINQEKKYAIEARNWLSNKIFEKTLQIKIHNKKDKYGRLLVTLWDHNNSINELLISEGYAVAYNGGKKLLWQELKNQLDKQRKCNIQHINN